MKNEMVIKCEMEVAKGCRLRKMKKMEALGFQTLGDEFQ